jgi:hypothetical protein
LSGVLKGLLNVFGIEPPKERPKLVTVMITFGGYFGTIIRWVWGVISIMRGYKFNFVGIILVFILLDNLFSFGSFNLGFKDSIEILRLFLK